MINSPVGGVSGERRQTGAVAAGFIIGGSLGFDQQMGGIEIQYVIRCYAGQIICVLLYDGASCIGRSGCFEMGGEGGRETNPRPGPPRPPHCWTLLAPLDGKTVAVACHPKQRTAFRLSHSSGERDGITCEFQSDWPRPQRDSW